MLTVPDRVYCWIPATLLAGITACAQVPSQPRGPWAVASGGTSIMIPAADGTQITAIVDGNSRIVSASGRTKAGTFLALQISYQTAGLTYTFNGPVTGLFNITVVQGQRAVAVQASTSTRARLVLIYQTPYRQVPSLDDELQTYTTDSPKGVLPNPKSGSIPGPMQVFPYVGNVFPQYEAAAKYFAPALDLIANSTPPWPTGNGGYTIATKLESDQFPPRKVCSIPDAAGSAYGLLVCIGVGIDSGTLSQYPNELLVEDGLTSLQGGGDPHGGKPCILGEGPKGMPNKDDCASPPLK